MRRLTLGWVVLGACRFTGPVAAPAPVAGRVSVQPWPEDAVVRIDGLEGRDREVLGVSAMVEVERDGFVSVSRKLQLAEAEHVVWAPRLEGESVTLAVESVPTGARVDVAGTVVGATPWVGEVRAGDLVVDVGLDGWRTERVERFVDGDVEVRVFLDPPDQAVDRVGLARTCSHPKAVAVHPTRDEVWVACLDGPPSLWVHSLPDGEVLASLDLGEHGAVELHFDEVGDTLWASQMETHRVYEVDVSERVVRRSMNSVSLWSKVIERSADGTHLYVSNWLGDDVSELSLATGQRTRRFPTVGIPRGLYVTRDGRSLYVAGFDAGQLARVDLLTGRSETLWNGGFAARHLVADEDRGRLYLSDMGRDALFVYDMASGGVEELATLIRNPNTIDLSEDGRLLFASCRGRSGSGGYLTVGDRGAVFVVDALTGEILDGVAAGHQPTGLDVRDGWLVFSDFRDDRLQIYQVPPREGLRGRSFEAVQRELTLPDPTLP